MDKNISVDIYIYGYIYIHTNIDTGIDTDRNIVYLGCLYLE